MTGPEQCGADEIVNIADMARSLRNQMPREVGDQLDRLLFLVHEHVARPRPVAVASMILQFELESVLPGEGLRLLRLLLLTLPNNFLALVASIDVDSG